MDQLMKDILGKKNVVRLQLNFDDLKIQKSEIINTLGYPEDEIHHHFLDIINEILEKTPGFVDIQAGYCIYCASIGNEPGNTISIENTEFSASRIVTSQIKNSEYAAVFLCSIGNKMEKWIKELSILGEPEKSYIADTIASAITEEAANFLHDLIGEKMRERGLNITNRYSPGYCNWSVSDQQLLFSLLPTDFCGVSLTESSLMIPIKSISGIIGIGKNVKELDYLCDKCGVKNCTYRAIRKREENKRVR